MLRLRNLENFEGYPQYSPDIREVVKIAKDIIQGFWGIFRDRVTQDSGEFRGRICQKWLNIGLGVGKR